MQLGESFSSHIEGANMNQFVRECSQDTSAQFRTPRETDLYVSAQTNVHRSTASERLIIQPLVEQEIPA